MGSNLVRMVSVVTVVKSFFQWPQDEQTDRLNASFALFIHLGKLFTIRRYIRGTMMRSKAKLLESLATEFLESSAGDQITYLDEVEFENEEPSIKVAQSPKAQEANLTPAVNDAFFGPPAHGLGPDAFVARISRPDSNFNKAAGSVQGKITINIIVNAPAKAASFQVKGSGIKAQAVAIQKALEDDYALMYGKSPAAQLSERLAANLIRPADIHGSATVTTI